MGRPVRVVFVGRDRRVWKRIALYLVTLGVSRRVWLHRVNKEIDGHEALGLDHRRVALFLTLPLVGLALFLTLLAAGVSVVWAAVAGLVLFAPSSWVTAAASFRARAMLEGSGIPYGPAGLVYAATWVPVLGHVFYIAWMQTRLNRYWAYEREHPEHGLEIDVDLSEDPRFLVEVERALKESYAAGSRFERKKRRKAERWAARRSAWQDIQAARAAVRAAGGSTPVLPWRRPQRPRPRLLKVTCGRCGHRFEVRRDPLAETVIHCPKCGLHEVVPSLRGDPLAGRERAAYRAARVTCPHCATTFHAKRDADRPTQIRCPECGAEETLPPLQA